MKLASVEKVLEVYPHPNADSLEFVKVLGFRCIVPKDKYRVGDYVVLIQPDTVLPDFDWAQMYKKRSKRVKAIRLRGEWSFGIVEDPKVLLPHHLPIQKYEGSDCATYLGITKYEAAIPEGINIQGTLPHNMPRTGETKYQNIDLTSLYGSKVDVTLKVDGESCSFFYKDGEFGTTGRRYQYTDSHKFTCHLEKYDIERKLMAYCQANDVNLAIRGESYGTKKSKDSYRNKGKGFVIFSVFNLDTLEYERKGSSLYFPLLAKKLDIPHVPIIEQDVVLSEELLEHYSIGINKLGEHMFEGVVINHPTKTFKVINLHYDERK